MSPQEKYITELITPYLTGEYKFSITIDSDGNFRKCLYNGPGGSQCAFARVCEEPQKLPEKVTAKSLLNMSEGAPKLKPEAAALNMSSNEWAKVQYIHDYLAMKNPCSYFLNGLSHYGPFTDLRAAIEKYLND